MHKRLLGLDFGLARIGAAVGQSITQTATPVGILAAIQGQPNLAEFNQLIRNWKPDAIVIGIPRNMDGSDALITSQALKFVEWVRQSCPLPVYTTDERLTTREARLQLKELDQKNASFKRVDALAACLILETFMNQSTNSL